MTNIILKEQYNSHKYTITHHEQTHTHTHNNDKHHINVQQIDIH